MARTQTRMTRQRAIILEELRKTQTHPTVDEIYGMVKKRLPRISLGTVYRNLDLLAGSGDIIRMESASSVKRFDGNTIPHQHVRCVKCGRIGDVIPPCKEPDPRKVEARNFIITASKVEFEGLCSSCAAGDNLVSESEPEEIRHSMAS